MLSFVPFFLWIYFQATFKIFLSKTKFYFQTRFSDLPKSKSHLSGLKITRLKHFLINLNITKIKTASHLCPNHFSSNSESPSQQSFCTAPQNDLNCLCCLYSKILANEKSLLLTHFRSWKICRPCSLLRSLKFGRSFFGK